MRDKSSEVRVGALVIISFFIVFFAILWSKEFSFRSRQQKLRILFPTCEGLEVGDPVKIAGIKKGSVKEIELHGGGALVTIALSKDVKVYADARAKIGSAELMGTEMIALDPGQRGAPLSCDQSQEPINGTPSITVGEMIAVVGEVALHAQRVIVHLERALSDFNASFGNPETQRALLQSVANLESASREVRTLLEVNEPKLRSTITNFDEASSSLASILTSRRAEIDSSLAQFFASIEALNEFSGSLKTVMARIDQGEGTLGKFLSDDEMYRRMQSITSNLDAFSEDLKKNFGRYLAGSNIHLINLIAF